MDSARIFIPWRKGLRFPCETLQSSTPTDALWWKSAQIIRDHCVSDGTNALIQIRLTTPRPAKWRRQMRSCNLSTWLPGGTPATGSRAPINPSYLCLQFTSVINTSEWKWGATKVSLRFVRGCVWSLWCVQMKGRSRCECERQQICVLCGEPFWNESIISWGIQQGQVSKKKDETGRVGISDA